MLKIALDAGHRMDTPGKRCLKVLDPKETREWWLNDRIADQVEKLLSGYDGVDILRVDDTTGKKEISLAARCTAANNWKAGFYLSIHHNAGVNGGSGGGIVAYTHPKSSKASVEWRDALYEALIRHTGLKGNRSNPKATSDLHVLRETDMPAVLLELGFMDSRTDVPIILTDDFAKKCAEAIVEVLVKRGKMTKKAPPAEKPQIKVDPAKNFNRAYAKTYTVTASALNMRTKAGTTYRGEPVPIIKALPKGAKVTCYGYYTQNGATVWLYIKDAAGDVGFCSKKYLK